MALYSQEDLFILGIRRSGNHAAANWLIPHYEGLVRYFNDYTFAEQMQPECQRLEGNPTYLYMNQQGHTFCLMNRGQVWTVQEIVAKELVRHLSQQIKNPIIKKFYQPDKLEELVNQLYLDPMTSKLPYWVTDDIQLSATVNLFGCENQTPFNLAEILPQWETVAYQRIASANQIQLPSNRTCILVLRNPFNNLASLMKNPATWPPNGIPLEQFPATWIAYAKEYLGVTAHLKTIAAQVICLNYDFWFTDPDYRRSLSEKLGRPFTDAGLEQVSLNGSGSSFDSIDLSGNAQKMKVLERWKAFQTNETFLTLLKNDELLALYEQIYGPVPLTL